MKTIAETGSCFQPLSRCILTTVTLFTIASAWAVPFTAGNLVVERMGDGAAALSSAATNMFILEYTPNGAPVQTNAMPVVFPRPAANPFNLVDSGSATSNGQLTRSADGKYLCISGYNGTNGEAGIAGSSVTTVLRVIGIINAAGAIDTSRAAGFLSGNNFRSVTSVDGSAFWAAGASGLVCFQPGVATNLLNNGNIRCVKIFNNQLYVSSASATPGIGVHSVGSGLPTTNTQTTTQLITVGGTSPSPYEFEFNSALTTAYVADDRNNASGGIIKYTFSGSTWSSNYTLPTIGAANVGARGLAVDWSGANPVIYATTSETSANRLVRIEDTNSSATAVTLATTPASTAFRGLAFAPVSSAVTTPVIQNIRMTGGNVIVDFTGGASDAVTDFTVLSSTDLATPLSLIAATITQLGPGQFRATISAAAPAAFYRIKR